MKITVQSHSTTSKVAVKIKLLGGYEITGPSNWASYMTPAQKAQQAFFNKQMNR